MGNKIPSSVTDTLLHVKESDTDERVVMPITRYCNVLQAPKVVENIDTGVGSEFMLYATDRELVSIRALRNYFGRDAI